jgi:long-chain acyl-CoA synthetase
MQGYWEKPDANAESMRTGPDGTRGWFFTGDIGVMDEDGYFRIVDRKNDMIIASGYNVYPAEVEAVLYDHPKVLEAAVYGVADEKRGENVKAAIVLKPGETATQQEIIDFCKQQLAAYKVPKVIQFQDELPKSLIGKVLRRVLREEDQS